MGTVIVGIILILIIAAIIHSMVKDKKNENRFSAAVTVQNVKDAIRIAGMHGMGTIKE